MGIIRIEGAERNPAAPKAEHLRGRGHSCDVIRPSRKPEVGAHRSDDTAPGLRKCISAKTEFRLRAGRAVS